MAAQLKTAAARSGNVRPTATVVPLRALRASESGEALPNTVPITARTSGSPRAFLTDEARLHAALDCLWLEADPKRLAWAARLVLGATPKPTRVARVRAPLVVASHYGVSKSRIHALLKAVRAGLGTASRKRSGRPRSLTHDVLAQVQRIQNENQHLTLSRVAALAASSGAVSNYEASRLGVISRAPSASTLCRAKRRGDFELKPVRVRPYQSPCGAAHGVLPGPLR